MNPKYETHKNKAYEGWIRAQGCLVSRCGNADIHVHHVWHGRRNAYCGVPLCHYHHTFGPDSYHVIGHDLFESTHSINLSWEIINFMARYIDERDGLQVHKASATRFDY